MNADAINTVQQDAGDIARYLYGAAMLEGWATRTCYESPDSPAGYLAVRSDMAAVSALFLAASRCLHDLAWSGVLHRHGLSQGEVVHDVCRPFGAWIAEQTRARQRPEEPAWRHWLVNGLMHLLIDSPDPFLQEQHFVTTALLMTPAVDYTAAVDRVARMAGELHAHHEDTGLPPFRRYWIMSGPAEEYRDGNGWHVQLAIETAAINMDEAYTRLEGPVAQACDRAGIEWAFDVPEGKVYASGTVSCTAHSPLAPAAAGAGMGQWQARGLLPPHLG